MTQAPAQSHLPVGDVPRLVEEFLAAHPSADTPAAEFLGARFDAGLAWPHFPRGCGGLGASREFSAAVAESFTAAGAPDWTVRNGIGYGMAAPTLVALGTDEQKSRYLRRIYTCEDVWCQLFSEPGAGSDVAGLVTRAVLEGGRWIVNGQKVWTTSAHRAAYGLLIARTDPEARKHDGLTYFVLDMRAPGVVVRPLRQMTGDTEFNEVFLSDVRIADEERLGEVGRGWAGVLVTLMNERHAIGTLTPTQRGEGPLRDLLDIWSRARDRHDDVTRNRVACMWIESEVQRLTAVRASASAQAGTPGPEGAVLKIMRAEMGQRLQKLRADLLQAEGLLYEVPPAVYLNDPAYSIRDRTQWWFLRSRASTLEGGTSEILRNQIAERILGLPGDVRVDKDKPWSSIPRSPERADGA